MSKRPCYNCGSAPVAIKGQCRTCDRYQQRTGRKRPQSLVVRRNRKKFEDEQEREMLRRMLSITEALAAYGVTSTEIAREDPKHLTGLPPNSNGA